MQREIAAPRDQVAAFAMDPANDTDWIGGISRADVLTNSPFGVGTRVARTASFMRRSFDYTLEVVEQVPGRALGMRSVAGPFDMTVRYEFEDTPGGTLARIIVGGNPGRFYKVAGPLMRAGVRRNLARDLRRLEARTSDSRVTTDDRE